MSAPSSPSPPEFTEPPPRFGALEIAEAEDEEHANANKGSRMKSTQMQTKAGASLRLNTTDDQVLDLSGIDVVSYPPPSGAMPENCVPLYKRTLSVAVERPETAPPVAEKQVREGKHDEVKGQYDAGIWKQMCLEVHGRTKRMRRYIFTRTHPIFVVCFICFAWGIINTFAPPPVGINTGMFGKECAGPEFHPTIVACICPRHTVCARNNKSILFLVFARASAYFDYPLYVGLFVTKMHNLRTALQRSYVSEFFQFDDLHRLHTMAGCIVGVEVLWHSFWHLLRWGLAGEMHLLWTTATGVTGMLCLCLTAIIVLPMAVTRLRRSISFELRKGLHYLSIVWAISLALHAPSQHVGWVMGLALGIYLIDFAYGFFFRIYHIETLYLTRLGSAVIVTWQDPPGFLNKVPYMILPAYTQSLRKTRTRILILTNKTGRIRVYVPSVDERMAMARLFAHQASDAGGSLERVHCCDRGLDQGSA